MAISDSLDPKETPSLFALAPISEFDNAEKDSFHLVPGEMAWKRCSVIITARSICVASPFFCIFTLSLERTGEESFWLMPPKAITSLVGLLVVDDGVEGLKEIAATRDSASACRVCSLGGTVLVAWSTQR
jgi:hypothetical protein